MKFLTPRLLLISAALLASSVVSLAENPVQQAWQILQTGAAGKGPEARAAAVGALGLALRNPRAGALAEKALEDEKTQVRVAAARALGQMLYAASVPKLRKALADKEDSVVMAAAHSLVQLKDSAGYELYYSVLTGERKKGQGLISREMDVLKDPKQVAELSLEEGIGFLPCGGFGLSAIQFLREEERDKASAKVVAARFLADDPDPQSSEALVRALSNKSWLVREAALEAIANRADPSLLEKIQAAMTDEKDHVRYTAAATVIRLTDVRLAKGDKK
jgi:HEAT repeat protein